MTQEARSGDETENSGLQLELSCAGSEAELLLTFFPSVLVYVRGGCDRETFSRGLWKVFFTHVVSTQLSKASRGVENSKQRLHQKSLWQAVKTCLVSRHMHTQHTQSSPRSASCPSLDGPRTHCMSTDRS